MIEEEREPSENEFRCPATKGIKTIEDCEAPSLGNGCLYLMACEAYKKQKEKENEKHRKEDR